MKIFKAESFIKVTRGLAMCEGFTTGVRITEPAKGTELEKTWIGDTSISIEELDTLEKECVRLGLAMSAKTVHRMKEQVLQYNVKEFEEDSKEFLGRLEDEMGTTVFFCIETDKQSLLLEKNQFGTEVTEAFPSAIVDIEEASKCLAFERWTACVFHLMRVMEVGLRVLESTLKLPTSTNPSWSIILEKCDNELKKSLEYRSPEWKSDNSFFAETTAMLHSVKDAWRNPTMHVEKTYTQEQAEDIWNAVKGFMRHLATKLHEDTI